MEKSKTLKLQYLLIQQLLKDGTVELLLPDGITLEIGIMQEDKYGEKKKADDYCYVTAKRNDKSTHLDAYNLGLQCKDQEDIIVFDDKECDKDGTLVRVVEIV